MSRRAIGRDRKRRVAVVAGVMLLIATILVLCLLAYRPAHIRGVSSDAFERSVASSVGGFGAHCTRADSWECVVPEPSGGQGDTA